MNKGFGRRWALGLEMHSKGYDKVLGLFYACTEEEPEKRPSAEMILQALLQE